MSTTAGCTNTDKRHFPLRIERMPDGGFMVGEALSDFGRENGRYCAPLFASTSIGDALAFIAGRLDPEAFKALQEHQAKAAAELEASRDFAKGREAPDRPCNTCGIRPGEQPRGCRICGRGVGVSEFKQYRRSDAGEWAKY